MFGSPECNCIRKHGAVVERKGTVFHFYKNGDGIMDDLQVESCVVGRLDFILYRKGLFEFVD